MSWLPVACTAVGKHKSVVCVSYLMMVLQFMWIVLMVLAITGIYAAQIDSQNQLTPVQKDQCKSMQPFDSQTQCQAQCSAGTCSSSSIARRPRRHAPPARELPRLDPRRAQVAR